MRIRRGPAIVIGERTSNATAASWKARRAAIREPGHSRRRILCHALPGWRSSWAHGWRLPRVPAPSTPGSAARQIVTASGARADGDAFGLGGRDRSVSPEPRPSRPLLPQRDWPLPGAATRRMWETKTDDPRPVSAAAVLAAPGSEALPDRHGGDAQADHRVEPPTAGPKRCDRQADEDRRGLHTTQVVLGAFARGGP